MTSELTWARRPDLTLQLFLRLHPEWWTVVLCGAAWVIVIFHGWQHAGHEFHQAFAFKPELMRWMVMVTAMMLPLVIDRVPATAQRSLWNRRHRAIGGFLTGYCLPWTLLGLMVAALRKAPWTHSFAVPALGFLLAALWQLTRMHRRAMRTCHQIHPLAPTGWKADFDCLRFGGVVGAASVWSCGPLMIACALTGHNPVAMFGGMAVGLIEHRFWPRTGPMLGATLALAGYFGLLAVWGFNKL